MKIEKILSNVVYESNYRKGPSLTQKWANVGWVELLQRTGSVYYCKHPTEKCFKSLMDLGKGRLRSLLLSTRVESQEDLEDDLQFFEYDLGLAIHLAHERLKEPFILPPMGNIQGDWVGVGTGTSRLAADLMCATPPEEIVYVGYVSSKDKADLPSLFHSHQKILSTEEFNNIFNLSDLDYKVRIDLLEHDEPLFRNTIISHTAYDTNDEEISPFTNTGKHFTQKLIGVSNKDNQILVEVRCTEKVSHLIPKSDGLYKINVEIQKDNEWAWSYGRFLALTNDKEVRETQHKVYILVYDISEPLNLDLALLWLGSDSVYQTKDLKLAVFTPGRSGSIKEVANFVK